MNFQVICRGTDGPSRRLILLFAGWGMSPRPLEDVSMAGYDIAVVWDYRDMSAAWLDEVARYDEVVLVAWSYGVHAAARFLSSHHGLPVTARIAVNGTRFTADDRRGIPCDIFHATLDGLSERSVTKFNMRMCGGASAYKAFAPKAPERSIDDLREELASFDTAPAPAIIWDKAFISDSDAIIPPANQHEAWRDEATEIIHIDSPHLPDFNALLRRCLTDKAHIRKRFHKAELTYDANAGVQLTSSSTLIDMAARHITSPVGTMLEAGCGTGRSSRMAIERLHPQKVILWDLHISPQVRELAAKHPDVSAIDCDAETEICRLPDGSVDLLLSASTVQWFNSLRAFLLQTLRVLSRGGIAAISTYGPDTMHEVHEAMGSKCRFPSSESIMKMIPKGLEAVACREEHVRVLYESPLEVLRHLSRTGVNGLHAPGDDDSSGARAVISAYPTDSDGSAPLTYHPIYLILRKL